MQTIRMTPAGLLPSDESVEIFADRKEKKAFFISKGRSLSIDELPNDFKRSLLQKMLRDKPAMKEIGHLGYSEAIKRYAFCLYGSLDHVPDFHEGELSDAENFRCGKNCTCLKWKFKSITTINGRKITPRQLEIIELLRAGLPGKQIADRLNIELATLNNHKQAIMLKLDAHCTADIINKSIEQNIIN